MFSTVRRFIKTAILFLFVGLAYGGTLLYRREILGRWPSPHQVSAHAHIVGIGFVMFLILGVALWLFPRPGLHRSSGWPSTSIPCGPGSDPWGAISGRRRAKNSDGMAGLQTVVLPALMAFHTRSGVNGSRSMRTPTAS